VAELPSAATGSDPNAVAIDVTALQPAISVAASTDISATTRTTTIAPLTVDSPEEAQVNKPTTGGGAPPAQAPTAAGAVSPRESPATGTDATTGEKERSQEDGAEQHEERMRENKTPAIPGSSLLTPAQKRLRALRKTLLGIEELLARKAAVSEVTVLLPTHDQSTSPTPTAMSSVHRESASTIPSDRRWTAFAKLCARYVPSRRRSASALRLPPRQKRQLQLPLRPQWWPPTGRVRRRRRRGIRSGRRTMNEFIYRRVFFSSVPSFIAFLLEQRCCGSLFSFRSPFGCVLVEQTDCFLLSTPKAYESSPRGLSVGG